MKRVQSAGTSGRDTKAKAKATPSPRKAGPTGRVAKERPPPFADELWACIHCNYCSAECPTARQVGWESSTPRGKIRMLRDLVEQWSPKRGVVVPEAFVRGVYECTSCGRCSQVCHVDIDYLAHNEAMRRWLARSDCGPMEDHEVLVRSLDNYGNPYLSPRRDRARWAEGLDLPKEGEVLYFAGCSDSFVHPQVAQRTVTVLRALGLDVAYLGVDEPCCGSTAARLGLDGTFDELANDVVGRIASTGAKMIITACPGCSSAFREYYPGSGHDVGVEVLHLTELLDRELEAGRLKVTGKLPGRFAWYDPCHLGRIDGVFEPPRRVLTACVEQMVELDRNRVESLCCGSGGGLKTAFPDQALGIGGRVVDLAADADVGTLVTACPWCETNIGDASAAREGGLEVVDLVEVVFRALGLEEPSEDKRRERRAPGRLGL
ncbi:MAG: (Fe-S)-binding protein [Thermoplasmata archaeon]|nr:MAG: (Fe-S)-binding protein [Thermoplasmata archaeon]